MMKPIVVSLMIWLLMGNGKGNEPIFFDDFATGDTIPNTDVWELCAFQDNAWARFFANTDGYENVRIQDGILKLTAAKRDTLYTTGGIRTKQGFGNNTLVEVRARLSHLAPGVFPAIWQMPIEGDMWPRSGEVDIFEWIQGDPDQIYQTIHTHYNQEVQGATGSTNPNPTTPFDATQYHVYGAARTSDAVIFFVDGVETWRYDNMHLDDAEVARYQFPFDDHLFDIILNCSLGGELNGQATWAGPIDDHQLPVELWVDWVKVTPYKESKQ